MYEIEILVYRVGVFFGYWVGYWNLCYNDCKIIDVQQQINLGKIMFLRVGFTYRTNQRINANKTNI